jgi:hypothetical protein
MNAYEIAGAAALPSMGRGIMPDMHIRHPIRFALLTLLSVPLVYGLLYAYTEVFKTDLF